MRLSSRNISSVILIIPPREDKALLLLPVGNLEGCRGYEVVFCRFHSAKLFIASINGLFPAQHVTDVLWGNGTVALLQIQRVNSTVQVRWERTGPAIPRQNLLWLQF